MFAAGLSAMYAAEVPGYATLVQVCTRVNADHVARHPDAERWGSLRRVTAERHGAIRVGSPAELRAVADLFAAFGMAPVGYYDLRRAASPIPVVCTAFRPVDGNELSLNPFRMFTSMLATRDRRYFDRDLRARVDNFLAHRQLFDPALLARARSIAAAGGCADDAARPFVAAAVASFALSGKPIERSWYDELSRVSAVAADIAGVCSTHLNHLTPRVLDIDELYRRMTGRGIA
ncbi:2-oxoadipate dioxygenase/decarboxylase family protein, partial [Mycobacterium avium]